MDSETRTQLLWDDRPFRLPRPHDRILDDFQEDLERVGELEAAELRELLVLVAHATGTPAFKAVTLTVYGDGGRVLFAATAAGWREVPTGEVVEEVDVDYQDVIGGKDGNRANGTGDEGEPPRRAAG